MIKIVDGKRYKRVKSKSCVDCLMEKLCASLSFSEKQEKLGVCAFLNKNLKNIDNLYSYYVFKLPIKDRFFKFLKDEGIWYCYWQNVKNRDESFKIAWGTKFKPNYYLYGAFRFEKATYLSRDFWLGMDRKWLKILKEEYNYEF